MDVKVRMLKDIPAYNGVDDLRFGPFKAGEELMVPESEARWLVTGKLAVSIGPMPLAPVAIGLMNEARASVKLDGETQSEPDPKKRKKYAPRGGASCPECGVNLRTAFCTINEGGLKASKRIQICPKCDEGYKITRIKVPEIINKE
jgi:hypothetical protein